MKTLSFILVSLALALSGCVSRPAAATWWNPLTWMSGSEGRKLEQAHKNDDVAEAAALKAAQRTAHETQGHLAVAPASRQVENARESNDKTVTLLDQVAGPLTAEEAAAIRGQVEKLNSENATLRAEGERIRAEDRGRISQISAELGEARAKLAAANTAIAGAFDRENALANELRNAHLIKWAGVAWGVLATAAAIAYKLNLGGLQMGVGNAFGVLKARYGADDVDVRDAAHEIDALIAPRQQAAIARFSAAALAEAISKPKSV